MRVLLTGATGFIGSALLKRMVEQPVLEVRAASRRALTGLPAGTANVVVAGLTPEADWRAALEGVDCVVHAAARVHVMKDRAGDPLAEFRRVNVEGSLHLARQAAAAGVRRFVFVSSIKVNGEQTLPGLPYTPEAPPAPIDPYGVSKLEAERALKTLADETGMEVVAVRPPLVYGPGVKGNFLTLIRWLRRGVPLPLGAIANRRSLVALDNLVDLVATCVDHPAAANQIFLAGDGEDVSTTELLRRLGAAMDIPVRLVPVPASILEAGAAVLGKRAMAQRLCGNLQVDISKAHRLLGWTPRVTVEEGLRSVATWFRR